MHEGFIFKLKQFGVDGALLTLFKCYLTGRSQWVVLNGKVSLRKLTKAGVPQCFILVPLIFLIYSNDIKENIQSNIKKISDDTSLINTFHNQVVEIQVLN